MSNQPISAVPDASEPSQVGSTPVVTDLYNFTNLDAQAAAIDLTELRIWPPRQGERGEVFPIWPELRIAEQIIITDDWRIAVHLTRAELAARFTGCSVAPGTRYGDIPLSPSVEMTETAVDERDFSRSGEASTALSGGLSRGVSLDAEVKASVKGQIRSKTAIEHKSEIVQYRVATLPNDRWEIVEPRGWLRGSYLVAPAMEVTTEMPLCRVIAESQTVTISLSLEVRPHDIDPVITSLDERKWIRWSNKEKPNKISIAKLLIAKACTESFSRPGDERVTLARAVLQGERRIREVMVSDDTPE